MKKLQSVPRHLRGPADAKCAQQVQTSLQKYKYLKKLGKDQKANKILEKLNHTMETQKTNYESKVRAALYQENKTLTRLIDEKNTLQKAGKSTDAITPQIQKIRNKISTMNELTHNLYV